MVSKLLFWDCSKHGPEIKPYPIDSYPNLQLLSYSNLHFQRAKHSPRVGKDNIGKYYDIKFWEVSLHLVKIVEVSNPQKIPIPFLYLSSIKKEIEGLGGGGDAAPATDERLEPGPPTIMKSVLD